MERLSVPLDFVCTTKKGNLGHQAIMNDAAFEGWLIWHPATLKSLLLDCDDTFPCTTLARHCLRGPWPPADSTPLYSLDM